MYGHKRKIVHSVLIQLILLKYFFASMSINPQSSMVELVSQIS